MTKMNNLPQKIYLEETTIGDKTGTRSTVNETEFNNWQAVYKLMARADLLNCRYYIGHVDWEEVTGDD